MNMTNFISQKNNREVVFGSSLRIKTQINQMKYRINLLHYNISGYHQI